jgi:hypothetical protein
MRVQSIDCDHLQEHPMKRHTLAAALLFTATALLTVPSAWAADTDFSDVRAEIARQHDEGVQRLQDWIRLPSIAAQDLGYPEGPDHVVRLLL